MDDDLLLAAGFTVLVIFCAMIVALLAQVPAQRRKVEQRAYTLLKEWLSPEQLARFEVHGHFEVRGSHSGKCYRIRDRRFMNIDELDKDGPRLRSGASAPRGAFPSVILCWHRRSRLRPSMRSA